MNALSNTPVAAKILGVVGLLAALTLGVTVFALSELSSVEATYSTLLDVHAPTTGALATARAAAAAATDGAQTMLLVAALAGLAIIGGFAAFVAAAWIARPLARLSQNMQKLAAGDASASFAKDRRDEIGRIESALAGLQVALRDAYRLKQMVDEMPINVMTCDPKDDFKINYMNKESLRVLRSLEQFLPRRADEIVGQSFDIFHKNPGHQRAIVSNPDRLPWNAKIKLGPETLDLRVSAIRDQKGAYVGPMVTWAVITKQVKLADDFEANVMGVVHAVSRSAEAMQLSASTMTATAEETSRQATTVASAAEEATSNVQTVAAAAEELTSSVNEISRQVAESAAVARQAVQEAQRTNVQVTGLADAAQKIGDVVRLISDIAAQTNLLALNATIEAARAGEAGKGFAVVASEVKSLANQTARATEEIGTQISSIQAATTDAVSAINGIGQTIQRIDAIASTIAAAVEEQGAATREISRNVQEAATGTGEVSSNIVQVSKAAESSGEAASHVVAAAEDLTGQSARLKGEVETFLTAVRAA